MSQLLNDGIATLLDQKLPDPVRTSLQSIVDANEEDPAKTVAALKEVAALPEFAACPASVQRDITNVLTVMAS